MIQLKTRLSVVYNRSPHIAFVLGIFAKSNFSSDNFPSGNFPNLQFPNFCL